MASKKVTISLVTLLLISAAGNLFFAGLVAGRAMHPDKQVEKFVERDRDLRAQIPDEDRKKLRKLMHENLPQMKKAKSEFDKSRRKVHQAISADPLDEAALRAAVDEMLGLQNDMQKALADSIVEAAPDLSPEGRKAMVQHILFRDEAKDRTRDAIRRKMMDRQGQNGGERPFLERMRKQRAANGDTLSGGQGPVDRPPMDGPPMDDRVPPDMDYPPPPPPPGMEPDMGDMDVDESRPLMPPE